MYAVLQYFIVIIIPVYSGKNLFLLAKTIFASPVFSMENTGFFHLLAKTCQPWPASNI